MSSIPVIQKKRGRPATGQTPRVGVRLPDQVREAIDAYIADQKPPPNQSEAIRAILANWLSAHGYLPADQEGTRPEDLNASNDG